MVFNLAFLTKKVFYSKKGYFCRIQNENNNKRRDAVIDSNREVQIFKYLQNVRNFRIILKIEGCNLGLSQKSRGAIAPLAPL